MAQPANSGMSRSIMRHVNKAVSLAFRPPSFCCFGAIGLPPSRCTEKTPRVFFDYPIRIMRSQDWWGLEIQKNPTENSFVLLSLFFGGALLTRWFLGSIIFSFLANRNILNLSSPRPGFHPPQTWRSPLGSHPIQEVPPMMRETQKDGPKDGLRPVSLEELKKHSHQAGIAMGVGYVLWDM